jgi:dipeptidyl aminopeptidase/acylaminoacyl peptidase
MDTKLWRGLIRPAWSPDGTSIAFSTGRPMGSGVRASSDGLYVVNSDGGGPRQLVRGPVLGWHWSPDLAGLAFGRRWGRRPHGREGGGCPMPTFPDGGRLRLATVGFGQYIYRGARGGRYSS